MIRSSLGFIYTPDFKHVLLITKHKPIFHKGKLNGLGGKCEGEESALDCMSRETAEESGLVIPAKNWKLIGDLSWTEWHVTVFAVVYHGSVSQVQSLTEDLVAWYPVNKLPSHIIANLRWLIPLGIDVIQNSHTLQVKIKYSE